MKKAPEEIDTILDELSEDANQWPYESVERRKSTGVHQVDATISVQVQLDAMAKEIRKLIVASIKNVHYATCDICERGHPTHECQASTEEVNVVGNYNAMGQRHPGFSWSSPGGTANAWQQNNPRFQEQGATGFQNQQRQQYQSQPSNQSSMEDIMKTFIIKTDERLDAHDAAIKELSTSFRILEKQIRHLATLILERSLGTLLADTERNSKETVNAVNLRSGQVLKDPTLIQNDMNLEKKSGKQLKGDVDKMNKGPMKTEKKKEEKSRREEHDESNHMFALPFPQKLSREKLDKQIEKFLDVLKQVHVNLPFTEVLSQMSAYAKFLKEILTKKRKIKKPLVVNLTEHCGAILQNKLPQKCGDPGSFTIPCSLGTTNFDKSLCDSGASINLRPLFIYRKL
ncbi:uncharacterized protein [Nicotiana tomentosiformis]|uniref:uncharacterized protein n=1 Tax=Nicotiana tomentosiformis TaxID=4098 RepID=UPI00388C8AAC